MDTYQFYLLPIQSPVVCELNRKELVSESNNWGQSVLVHEFGHAFCLDDNPSSRNASIMNHDRTRNTLIKPTSNDIAGVNSAY